MEYLLNKAHAGSSSSMTSKDRPDWDGEGDDRHTDTQRSCGGLDLALWWKLQHLETSELRGQV